MKKLFFIVLILLFSIIFIMSGCGDSSTTTPGTTNTTQTSNWLDEPTIETIASTETTAQGPPVYQLYVNSEPHDIKGASFDLESRITFTQTTYPYVTDDIVSAGINSIRTYGGGSYKWGASESPSHKVEETRKIFELAKQLEQKSGKKFTVIIGLNMGNHVPTATGNQPGGDGNVNYNNQSQVKTQYDLITKTIDGIMDLDQSNQIGWSIGNEIVGNVDSEQTRINIYKAIDDIAKYIKETKHSNLLRMTCCPTLATGEINFIKDHTSYINCLGDNTYYGTYDNKKMNNYLTNAANEFKASKWTDSWIVSEFGSYTIGWQDIGVILNGYKDKLTLQANSSLVCQDFIDSYNMVSSYENTGGCLGGYVLNWEPPVYSNLNSYFHHMYAYKGDQGPFWEDSAHNYQQLYPDRLECVDSIRKAYGGSGNFGNFPKIILPSDNDVQGIDCTFKATLTNQPSVTVGQKLTATVKASYSGNMNVQWYMEGAGGLYTLNIDGYTTDNVRMKNGDKYGSTITSSQSGDIMTGTITFSLPSVGNYRLRAIVRNYTDDWPQSIGNAATASVMFQVR